MFRLKIINLQQSSSIFNDHRRATAWLQVHICFCRSTETKQSLSIRHQLELHMNPAILRDKQKRMKNYQQHFFFTRLLSSYRVYENIIIKESSSDIDWRYSRWQDNSKSKPMIKISFTSNTFHFSYHPRTYYHLSKEISYSFATGKITRIDSLLSQQKLSLSHNSHSHSSQSEELSCKKLTHRRSLSELCCSYSFLSLH